MEAHQLSPSTPQIEKRKTSMTTGTPQPTAPPAVETTRWRIDPARSSLEFMTPTVWGLTRVRGRFERYDGILDLRQQPALDLTIEGASLTTGNRLRDRHLRSAEFFDAEHHPMVRFISDSAQLEGERLMIRGELRGFATTAKEH
jgi:polyisoprenoid-binding protein YceI